MNQEIIVIGAFIFVLAIMGAIFAFIKVLGSPQQMVRRRLERYQARFSPNAAVESAGPRLAKDKGTPLEQMLREILPRPAELRVRLNKTGKKISLVQYATASGSIMIGMFILVAFVADAPIALALLIAFAFALAFPHMYINRAITKRLGSFIALFPEAIDLIVRGLRSGLPVNESMNTVSREIEDPVGVEFRIVGDAVRLGKTLDEALWEAAARIDTPDFKFFVISLSVQKETGGNLAETLENLSEILRRRQMMKLKIRALSSEGRASAYIVGSLPFVMFGILLLMNYDYASILFTDSRAIAVMSGALLWMSIGVFIMARMINFEI